MENVPALVRAFDAQNQVIWSEGWIVHEELPLKVWVYVYLR